MAIKKNNQSPLKTILVISMGFLFIYFILNWQPALLIAFGIGVLGLLSPFLAQKLEWFWLKLAYVLSLILPNILLSVVFFCVLTPVAIVSKIFGKKDPLKMLNTSSSVYRESNKVFDKQSFENPW